MQEPTFEIYGGHRIGDKAGQLLEHRELLQEVGLQIPQTWVIASEATEAMRVDQAKGGQGHILAETFKFIGEFAAANSDPAVVVRSSAEGDARGSGIYESKIVARHEGDIANATRQVVRSFSAPHAQEFRQQVKLGDDFAVILQPLVGQELSPETSETFGPPISGYGYSSSLHHPDGLLSVVPGIGGGVDRKGGELILPEDVNGQPFNEIVSYRWLNEQLQPESDFRPNGSCDLDSVRGLVFAHLQYPGSKDELMRLSILKGLLPGYDMYDVKNMQKSMQPFPYYPLEGAMRNFYPEEFFHKLAVLERRAGYPVYIEWALNYDYASEKVVPYVVQIAPYEQKRGNVPEVSFEEKYMACHTVTGSGVKKSDRIITIWNADDIKHLRRYNADPKNAGYILLFSSRLTTSIFDNDRLAYRDCNNAEVIIEHQDARHGHGSPIEHLRGAVDISNKLIGVEDTRHKSRKDEFTNTDESNNVAIENWRSDDVSSENHGELQIERGDFTVWANEIHDMMIVGRASKD